MSVAFTALTEYGCCTGSICSQSLHNTVQIKISAAVVEFELLLDLIELLSSDLYVLLNTEYVEPGYCTLVVVWASLSSSELTAGCEHDGRHSGMSSWLTSIMFCDSATWRGPTIW
jgi:hypothetical protein